MRSMTGFGRAAVAGNGHSINVELKTVNNRFLDINLRLPGELQALEAELKKLLSSKLARGRVEVNLQYDRPDEVTYELNRPLISGFLSAMADMKKEFDLPGDVDVNVIARLPNLVSAKKEEIKPEFAEDVVKAFNTAIDDLNAMRAREGGELAQVLEENLAGIEARIPAIEAEAASVGDEHRARLTRRIGEMLAKSESQIEIDQARLAQEVAYLVERSDIAEEIARLRTHISHFREIAADERDVGKRLDFLTQELNREANTIASKTNNMVIKENALGIKSEIEKIREQVQNVE